MSTEAFSLIVGVVPIHYLPVFGKPRVAEISAFGIGNSHGIGLPQYLPRGAIDCFNDLLGIHDRCACELLARGPIHRKAVVLQSAIVIRPKSLTDHFAVALFLGDLLSPFG